MQVHNEVLDSVLRLRPCVARSFEGLTVLDLGCGAGRDVFVLSKLVGEHGRVIGVDMTEEQLAVALRHEDHHRKAFGYAKSNVRFLHGYIERLADLDLGDASVDVIVSNCVLNLAPDKGRYYRRPGGFSSLGGKSIFPMFIPTGGYPNHYARPRTVRRMPGWRAVLERFSPVVPRPRFCDPRLVDDRRITIDNAELSMRTGNVRFYSATYRLFKLDNLEPACEDYGQAVVYRGTIPHHPHAFVLDKHHRIEAGKFFPACGNTWRMLHDTRFAAHFDFHGNFDRHYGIFPGCGAGLPYD